MPKKTCAFIISDFIDMTVGLTLMNCYICKFIKRQHKDSLRTQHECAIALSVAKWQQKRPILIRASKMATRPITTCTAEVNDTAVNQQRTNAIDQKVCKQLYVLVPYDMFFTNQIFRSSSSCLAMSKCIRIMQLCQSQAPIAIHEAMQRKGRFDHNGMSRGNMKRIIGLAVIYLYRKTHLPNVLTSCWTFSDRSQLFMKINVVNLIGWLHSFEGS